MNSNADKWFSIYTRLKNCDENGIGTCVTCGKMQHVKHQHCGHYIGRQHMATRFDEMNAGIQCVNCNSFNEGRKDVYEKYLIEKHGKQNIDLLKLRGKSTKHFSKFELGQIAKYYKSEAEKLAKVKQIKIW
jgi:hypothetical protein